METIKMYVDGNMICCIIGDMPEEKCVGFAATPLGAFTSMLINAKKRGVELDFETAPLPKTDEVDGSYYQSDKLIDRIDWENIMKMPRYAGGHEEQMTGLLKDADVIAFWNEGDYQGTVASCLQLRDTGEVVVFNDYYGSCSGCDAWENARDEDVVCMCKQLAAGAYIFKNLENCIYFLEHLDKEDGKNFDWDYDNIARGLLREIRNTHRKGEN